MLLKSNIHINCVATSTIDIPKGYLLLEYDYFAELESDLKNCPFLKDVLR